MRRCAGLMLLCIAALAVEGAGCHRHQQPANATTADHSIAYGLGAAEPDERKDAAENLRKDGGPPAGAVPHLLAALQRETDTDARAEMIITLGASGAPEAKPILDGALRDRSREIQSAGEKGLRLWNKKTGQVAPEALAKLSSPNWKDRRDAADDLRQEGGPPVQAVPALVDAAGKEKQPKALGAMLLTLGASGAPEAKGLIDAHVNDNDSDLRRWARKAKKSWLAKNGQAVRKDVETPQPAAQAQPTASTAGTPTAKPDATAPTRDGCDQFKDICGDDPFAVDKCKTEMKSLSYGQQVAWADCVNGSTERCQKAHDACVAKAKQAAK